MNGNSSYIHQTSLLKRLRNGNQISPRNAGVISEPIIIHAECANWQLGPEELTCIADAISSNTVSQESVYPLVTMDLSYNRICNLDFFNADVPDYSGLTSLIQAFLSIAKFCRFKKINFAYNIIMDDGIKIVSDLISPNGPIYLQEVILKGCNFHSKGLKSLSKHIDTNKSLVLLDLDENEFNPKGLEVFCESMKQNRRLKNLYLSSCKITGDGVSHIMNMLQVNYTLSILTLSHNDIGDNGAEVIGTCLKSISTLTHIDLQDNHITTTGASYIFSGLCKNTSIVFIGLKWNQIDDDIKDWICNCLDSNVSLKTIYMLGNPINVKVAEAIVKFSAALMNRKKGKAASSSEKREKALDIDISW